MSSQKIKPIKYPNCDFVGIRDKERLALEEISLCEKCLTKSGFSKSQIHQYKAEIWDLSEDLSGSDLKERDTKIMASDYFVFLQSLSGLCLVLYRKCLLSIPSQKSTKETLKYIRILELLALLRLISNEMSQTCFELVQSVLLNIQLEADFSRKQSSVASGKRGRRYFAEMMDGLCKQVDSTRNTEILERWKKYSTQDDAEEDLKPRIWAVWNGSAYEHWYAGDDGLARKATVGQIQMALLRIRKPLDSA